MRVDQSDKTVENTIEVTLVGGPREIPKKAHIPSGKMKERKVKIPHHGGYEHFELTSVREGADEVVFAWTMRTTIAE